ncbi:hypothetical protein [Thermovibrio sp.]
MKLPLSSLCALLTGGLLLTACSPEVKGIRYLMKLKEKECKECLKRVEELSSVKILKEYSSVKCLFLIEAPKEEAGRIKKLGCVEYLEADRKYRILYH